ncbi:hypothetical protein [Paraburkholderia sp. DHOC27]|nr:hypothetical protein [Paraburkholderia sp. DHOC27]
MQSGSKTAGKVRVNEHANERDKAGKQTRESFSIMARKVAKEP